MLSIELIGSMDKMETELDNIKSTITISLGTKNKLRKLKGGNSYENIINHLIILKNQVSHHSENVIELQQFKRKSGIYSFKQFKVLFLYNTFTESRNFIFDIRIKTAREAGKRIPIKEFIRRFNQDNDLLRTEYHIYFQLLETAIRKEIEPLFKHNGRFEDYFSWKEEFNMLNLSKRTFEEDVMDKLKNYKYGEGEL